MMQTAYPKHRFYFNVETESNGQQIANELPSYRIACQHIKHYAKETGNQQEVYYITCDFCNLTSVDGCTELTHGL